MARGCLRLFDPTMPRIMVNVSQERFLHVGLVTSLASKSRNFSKTEGVLRKTNVKSRFLSPEPRETKHLNRVKQVTTEDLLEGTGVKLKKLEGWIDVKKLSFEKVNKILNFLEEIGIEGKDKGKIIARRPGILTTKEELLRKRVQTMRIVGIYPESVAYVVKESPGVLTSRTEDSLPDKVSRGTVDPGGGGGVLPIMAYTGRLCPKGVPFSGFRYIKG